MTRGSYQYCQGREKNSTPKGGPAHLEGRTSAKGLSWIRIFAWSEGRNNTQVTETGTMSPFNKVPGLASGIELKVDTSVLWSQQSCCFGKLSISYFYFEFWKIKHVKVNNKARASIMQLLQLSNYSQACFNCFYVFNFSFFNALIQHGNIFLLSSVPDTVFYEYIKVIKSKSFRSASQSE